MPSRKSNCALNASLENNGSGNRASASGMGLSDIIRNLNAQGTSRNKYRAKKTEIDGIRFDSQKEAHRWIELRYMERARLITNLRRQVRFNLIPAQYKDGKLVERKVDYVADFVYNDQYGMPVIEDAKGVKTDVYKIKRKLMLEKYGIQIREV